MTRTHTRTTDSSPTNNSPTDNSPWLLGALIGVTSMLWGIHSASASSVQVSPAFVDYTMESGDTKSYEIQVTNEDEDAVGIVTSVIDYYYDEQGQKVFVEQGSVGEEQFSLSKWISVDAPDVFTLEPGASRRVPVTIDVPAAAEPGGHYGVIFFATAPPASEAGSGAQLQVSGRIGSLILIDVPGTIEKGASIESFKVGALEGNIGEEQFAPQARFETGPISFQVRYRNEGTTHFFPEGSITVTGGVGRGTWELPLQEGEGIDRARALPRAARNFLVTLNERKLFGKYTAMLHAQDGDGNELAPLSVSFWVMPVKTVIWWVLLTVIGIVLLTVLVKRYNRWVISRAGAPRP